MKRSPAFFCLIALPFVVNCNCSDSSGELDFTTIDNGNEAISAIVQHASAQDEAYATLLDIFSKGFTEKLFDPAVELDGKSYDDIVIVQQKIIDAHEAYLRALEYIENSKIQTTTSSLKLNNAGLGSEKYGLLKSVKSFFWDWAYGNQKRSRDRILTASEGTSAATKQEMFDTAKDKFGDKVGNSPDEMFTKLKNGELDKEAPQLHSNFATGVLDYGLECQDKKLTPTQVAAEEGAEGVKKGVDVVVDSSVAIVNAKLPGFSYGFKKGQDAVKKINKIYDKPVDAITAEVKVQAEKWLVGKIGDKLGGTAADVASTISKTAGLYIKHKNQIEQTTTTAPSGSCMVAGTFGSNGSTTTPADVKGIVMTGETGNTSANDVVVNLGDPTKGSDPVIVPCGGYTVDVVGDETTQTQEVTVSEGTDAVISIDLEHSNPQTNTPDSGTKTPDFGTMTPDSGTKTCLGGRYTVLDPGTAGPPFDGSGLVKDNTTGLVWMRVPYEISGGRTQKQALDYCSSKGMRLPTKDEVLGIAGSNFDDCAWPYSWITWTSTLAGSGMAWYVEHSGTAAEAPVTVSSFVVLCVL